MGPFVPGSPIAQRLLPLCFINFAVSRISLTIQTYKLIHHDASNLL